MDVHGDARRGRSSLDARNRVLGNAVLAYVDPWCQAIGEATLKYQPPKNAVADRWTAQGEWVSMETPDLPPSSWTEVVAQLPQSDRAELKQVVLEKMGFEDVPEPSAPAGHLQVGELASRLGVGTDEVVELLGNLGLDVDPDAYVGREIADRLVAHLASRASIPTSRKGQS